MTLLFRIAVFVPCVFLIMVVYCAPRATTAKGVASIAARKTVKVCGWTVVLVAAMLAIEAIWLP
ncbi:MAG: hypothetical protein KDB80_14090 [Planctomycetes bacterium]|nr:hypothetical protein [Planctomycetota bacterium]